MENIRDFTVEFSQLFCAFENLLNKTLEKEEIFSLLSNAKAPHQLLISQMGVSGKILVDKYTCAWSPALRLLGFWPHKAPDGLAAPGLENAPSPMSSIPLSPGWKERGHISSLILNTIVGEVIPWHLFLPQPDHSSLISTTQVPSPEPLLTSNWIVEGTRWRDGEGGGRHYPHSTSSKLSWQCSLRLKSLAK